MFKILWVSCKLKIYQVDSCTESIGNSAIQFICQTLAKFASCLMNCKTLFFILFGDNVVFHAAEVLIVELQILGRCEQAGVDDPEKN